MLRRLARLIRSGRDGDRQRVGATPKARLVAAHKADEIHTVKTGLSQTAVRGSRNTQACIGSAGPGVEGIRDDLCWISATAKVAAHRRIYAVGDRKRIQVPVVWLGGAG